MNFRKLFVGSPGNVDSIPKTAKVPQAVQAVFHEDILNPEVQRNDFNVYRSSTFGQARITKAGTSWKWEERSQGPFHGLTSGKQNFIVCF